MSAISTPLVDHVRSLNRGVPKPQGQAFFNIPDTTICRKAETFLYQALPPWIANHAMRTYAFAICIANYAGWDKQDAASLLGYNKELIFLACALHELGFDTEKGLRSPMSLEIWGGIKAREWLLEQGEFFGEGGMSRDQLESWADEVCESIIRHTLEFRGVSKRCRITLALLVLGAGQDLMGVSSDFVHEEDVKTICSRWPRAGYCEGLKRHAQLETEAKPACLFEDCLPLFDPGMFDVEIFQGLQGGLEVDK